MEIGDKIVGFKFKANKTINYSDLMNLVVGKEGVIEYIDDDCVFARFENNKLWAYPKKQAIKYLVK